MSVRDTSPSHTSGRKFLVDKPVKLEPLQAEEHALRYLQAFVGGLGGCSGTFVGCRYSSTLLLVVRQRAGTAKVAKKDPEKTCSTVLFCQFFLLFTFCLSHLL